MRIDLPTDVFTYPDYPLPRVWPVEQTRQAPPLAPDELERRVQEAVRELLTGRDLQPASSVAVGVGSRGLDKLPIIVRSAISALRAAGLHPFIVPAMGSHGGATAEGQASVLHDYGITQDAVGAEVRATMEAVEIGRLGGYAGPYAGHPVYCDQFALEADAILLINRIKQHTDFSGPIESGIAKMTAIGLGKRKGADSIHRYGAQGLRHLMPLVARFTASHLPHLGGVALLENELGHTAEVHALRPEGVSAAPEEALMERARGMAPGLPFQNLDVLVIDEMGKNISGAGMDTHVIGRGNMPSIPEQEWGGPNIRVLTVLHLAAASHGNACCVGLADITTEELIRNIDFEATLINERTSGEGGVLRARLPLVLPDAEACVRTAMAACGRATPAEVRFCRIRNTADTRLLEISEALLAEARSQPDLRVGPAPHALDVCAPGPLPQF